MFSIFHSSKTIAESGILHGYTDYHCHLLPGVDDGIKKAEDTITLLELMQAQGVKEVWFTPHVMEEMPNRPDGLHEVYDNLQALLSPLPIGQGLGKSLHLAAEHMLDSDFDLNRSCQLLLPGNHLLVETSYFSSPYNLKGILRSIQQAGVYPLLAHPCRYRYMSEKDYEELKSMGIHFQLNLPAITGQYGDDVKKKALWLLSHGYYIMTGTDTHRISYYKEFLEAKVPNKVISQLEDLLHLI